MRADRLLSLLMLLQSRGKMTAETLATELEVSVRTIYRDIDALGTAGVPVYTDRGPGGGVALLDSYRTNLTGLNEDEARALFMLSIPAPLDQLGVARNSRPRCANSPQHYPLPAAPTKPTSANASTSTRYGGSRSKSQSRICPRSSKPCGKIENSG